MDTPTIAQYYRETDPAKRKELLEQAIAEEGATEENQARKEIWDARYSMKSDLGGQADGYLKFWMTIEFNRTSGNRWFSSKGARKGSSEGTQSGAVLWNLLAGVICTGNLLVVNASTL